MTEAAPETVIVRLTNENRMAFARDIGADEVELLKVLDKADKADLVVVFVITGESTQQVLMTKDQYALISKSMIERKV